VHVADPHARVDRVRGFVDRSDVALGHARTVPPAATIAANLD